MPHFHCSECGGESETSGVCTACKVKEWDEMEAGSHDPEPEADKKEKPKHEHRHEHREVVSSG